MCSRTAPTMLAQGADLIVSIAVHMNRAVKQSPPTLRRQPMRPAALEPGAAAALLLSAYLPTCLAAWLAAWLPSACHLPACWAVAAVAGRADAARGRTGGVKG
jgi:hypothetical protein